jgi:hypothetical protein
MTVLAGVRKLSDAAISVVAELSASTPATAASFVFVAPGDAGQPRYGFATRGITALSYANISPYIAPLTSVVSGGMSLGGATPSEVFSIRHNGVPAATFVSASGVPGGGNYGNYPLYIGRRGGTSLPFNGHLYSLIVRGAQSTDAQIVSAETYVNSKTGAY